MNESESRDVRSSFRKHHHVGWLFSSPPHRNVRAQKTLWIRPELERGDFPLKTSSLPKKSLQLFLFLSPSRSLPLLGVDLAIARAQQHDPRSNVQRAPAGSSRRSLFNGNPRSIIAVSDQPDFAQRRGDLPIGYNPRTRLPQPRRNLLLRQLRNASSGTKSMHFVRENFWSSII